MKRGYPKKSSLTFMILDVRKQLPLPAPRRIGEPRPSIDITVIYSPENEHVESSWSYQIGHSDVAGYSHSVCATDTICYGERAREIATRLYAKISAQSSEAEWAVVEEAKWNKSIAELDKSIAELGFFVQTLEKRD
jgi:hypothetical protein